MIKIQSGAVSGMVKTPVKSNDDPACRTSEWPAGKRIARARITCGIVIVLLMTS
ncbi:hypothetical protein BMS3Abin10_00025 [bacterium BMS3Abin10]|nr:hypothetical protein BMS3Abin10_00025 [bacterium BMS3Abin10]GBE37895.1 hypothetical protein BMS3Bbin08_00493 [bacterium BMS3Bbin08]